MPQVKDLTPGELMQIKGELLDPVHEAICIIDGLVTMAEAMQDELGGHLRHCGGWPAASGFDEALTVALACIRRQSEIIHNQCDM